LDFSDMGSNWVTVRDAVAAGTLRPSDKGVDEVASRWDQLLRFAALRLGRELGADVQVVISRKEAADPSLRLARYVDSLVGSGVLNGEIRIPDAVGVIEVCADLRAGQVTVSVEVDAPKEGRLPTRVGWLARQLKDAPGQLRVDGLISNTKASTSELLSVVIADPTVLVDPQKRDFRAFRVAATSPLGAKRGHGRGAFIDSVLSTIDGFYGGVVQSLRPWTAKAPQLPKSGRSATEEAGIDTTPPATDLQESTPADLLQPPSEDRDMNVSPAVDSPAPEGSAASELVTWETASDRLERERSHDTLD
jgi:hypothetical protein